jgi:hypothetical protein
MTDAQKKARARFKKAIDEAAKLRKKNPKLSQAEAVKKAYAILYGKERTKKIGAPAKKAAKKAAPRKAAAKKSAPKKAAPKRAAKKCAPKKSAPGERHTDTKSHNVNIRVISGAGKEYDETQDMRSIIMLNDAIKSMMLTISRLQYKYSNYDNLLKENPRLNIGTKSKIAQEIAYWKEQIKSDEKLINAFQERINKYRRFTYK